MDYIISLTNRCNLRCSYCYERHLNTEYGSITPQIMHQIAKFINRRNDAGIVYLFGGEPLLYKGEVKFFCENLKAKKFVITTNGTLLDEPFIKWCIERGIIINMSHDGAKCDERGANRIILDKNLKLLLSYQPNTLVQLVYTQKSLPNLYNNILYLKDLGVRKVSATMDAFLVPEDPIIFKEVLSEQWKKIGEISDMFIYELSLKKNNILNHTQSTCEICNKKVFINWDGIFYPCVQFQNIPEYRCGDLTVGIEAEKAKMEHSDYSMRSKRCEGCEFAEYCRNSCACRKMSTTGTVRNISEAACLEEQVQIRTALEIIAKENESSFQRIHSFLSRILKHFLQ